MARCRWCLTTVGAVAELCIASELTSENSHLARSRRLSTDTAWRANKHLSAVQRRQQLALLHPPAPSGSFCCCAPLSCPCLARRLKDRCQISLGFFQSVHDQEDHLVERHLLDLALCQERKDKCVVVFHSEVDYLSSGWGPGQALGSI